MMKTILVSVTFCSIALLASCTLQKIDLPSADVWDEWKKPGHTKNDVGRILRDICGYKTYKEITVQQPYLSGPLLAEKGRGILIKAEECMLANGFIYIDEPDGYIGGACKLPSNQNLPSCRSLRTLKIP